MIQLCIKDESDLYNPYDPSRTRINEGVYQYLKSYCTPLEFSKQTHDTLQIITESAIDQEKFQKTLHDAVKRGIAEFDLQIAVNNRRFIWEIIAGILLSAVGVLFCNLSGQGAPGNHFVSRYDVFKRCCHDSDEGQSRP